MTTIAALMLHALIYTLGTPYKSRERKIIGTQGVVCCSTAQLFHPLQYVAAHNSDGESSRRFVDGDALTPYCGG